MTEFGKHDTTEEDLASNLPPWFPKDPSSGNYNLLKPIAEVIDEVDKDREAVENAVHPTKAETVDQLAAVADLVDVDPYENESIEHYRTRVIAEFQLLTSKGTVMDLLNGASTILGVSSSDLRYSEQSTDAGSAQLGVPSRSLDDLSVSNSEFTRIVEELIASSYSLDVLLNGSYEYISVTDYESGLFEQFKGHGGLDSNGDPKDLGGTYAGTLE